MFVIVFAFEFASVFAFVFWFAFVYVYVYVYVFVFAFVYVCVCARPQPPTPCPNPRPRHTQKRGTSGTPATARPVTGTAGRQVAHVLLIFLFRLPAEEDSNSGLQGSSRLHSRCTTLPESQPRSLLSIPLAFPCPECFSLCVWLGGGTQHTINLGDGDGGARAPPRAVFVVYCAVQN